MKPARIIVLIIAIAAGGIAALLAGRSEAPPPAPAPIAQIETVDVLIAGSDIGLGSTVSSQDLRWQSWPAESAGSQFIRRSDNPDAINQIAGSITRQSFANGEPIREAKLIKAKGSGYMAAILPKGKRAICDRHHARHQRGGLHSPERSRRRHPGAARRQGGRQGGRSRSPYWRDHPVQHPGPGDRSDRRGQERPARGCRQDRDARALAAPIRNARPRQADGGPHALAPQHRRL